MSKNRRGNKRKKVPSVRPSSPRLEDQDSASGRYEAKGLQDDQLTGSGGNIVTQPTRVGGPAQAEHKLDQESDSASSNNEVKALPLTKPISDEKDTLTKIRKARLVARRWRLAKWLALAAALAGIVLAVPQAFVAMRVIRAERLQRESETNRLMDEAWDLLSGQEGARVLVRPISDPSKLEIVRRKLTQVQELDPDTNLLALYWGFYYQGMRLYPQALQLFRISAKRPAESARAYAAMAITLKDLGHFDEAIDACHKALEEHCEDCDSVVQNTLGLLLAAKGLRDEAASQFQTSIAGKPSFSLAYINLARLFFTSGKHAEALLTIRSAMKAPLDPPDSLLSFLPVLLNIHAYVDANSIVDRVIAAKPRDTAALLSKALTLNVQNKPAESIIEIRAALEIDPHLGAAYRELAHAYALQDKQRESEEALREAIRYDPLDPLSHFNLGQTLAAKHVEQAIDEYRASIALVPRFPPAHFYLAKALEKVGDSRGGAEEDARARSLGMRSGMLEHVFEIGLARGCGFGEIDEQALRTPGDGSALTLLPPAEEMPAQPPPTEAAEKDADRLAEEARLMIKAGSRLNPLAPSSAPETVRAQLELAKGKLDTAMAENPNNPETWKHLGDYYLELHDLQNARKSFEKALAIDPNGVGGMVALAITLEELSDIPSAEIYLQEAIAARPNNPDGYTELGFLRQREGQLPEAKTLLEKAVQVDPQSYVAWHDLGVALDLSGDSPRAERAFREAIKLQPTYASSHRSLAIVLGKKGSSRMAEALVEAQKATVLRPEHSPNWSFLASLLTEASFDLEACAAAQKSVELDPGDAAARSALKTAEALPCTLPIPPKDQQLLLERALTVRFPARLVPRQ